MIYPPYFTSLSDFSAADLALRVGYIIMVCRAAGIDCTVPYNTAGEQIEEFMSADVAEVVHPLLDIIVMVTESLDDCLPAEPVTDEDANSDGPWPSLLDVLAHSYAIADILARHGIDPNDCFEDVEDLLQTLPPDVVQELRELNGGIATACLSMAMSAFDVRMG